MSVKTGAAHIRDYYRGENAKKYDRRSSHPKWKREQETVERWLGLVGKGADVLDIPVGTGRFLEAYDRLEMNAIGMDVSEDMMAQALVKCRWADLRYGDILDIPMEDRGVDCVVAVRIMSWLTRDEMQRAVKECARVAKTWIITGGGRHDENKVHGSEIDGFDLVERVHIDRDHRGDYELVLMRRS